MAEIEQKTATWNNITQDNISYYCTCAELTVATWYTNTKFFAYFAQT